MATKKKTANPLDKILSDYAEKYQTKNSTSLQSLDLLDFLETVSPHLKRPEHLSAVVPFLAAVEHEPQFFCFSAPPRHGKSTLVNHFVAWMMIRHPGIKIAYACYGLKLSLFFSDEVKDIIRACGYEIDRNRNSREEWRMDNGSLFKAVAPGSDFTGRGADVIIVDDPYKNRVTAESGAVREATWSWFTGVAYTRRSPQASVITTHTRWNIEDVIGVLDKVHKVPYVNLPAVNEHGEALWPEQWPKERLDETRAMIGEYDWASLYLGEPRPRGGAVFKEPSLYSEQDFSSLVEDRKIAKYAIGIDCAYTKKSHADYSVALVLAFDTLGRCYVVDMRRAQVEAPEFALVLKELRQAYGNPPIYWYVGGQEKVIADFFRNSCGIPVKDVPAKEDKFARAQSVAAAWNAGRVLIPDDDTRHRWLNKLLAEVLVFTGLDDPHDDIVDALAAAFIPNTKSRVPRGMASTPVLPF
jgi:predicted phage terminase large subunit-like protein